MPFVITLACRELRLTPAEAVRAATLGGAQALRQPDIGQLRPGARADLVVLDAPSESWLPYRPGSTWCRTSCATASSSDRDRGPAVAEDRQ